MLEFEKKVQIYVNPDIGSDDNRGSKAAPFKTLDKAMSTLTAKMSRSEVEAAYTLNLSKGTHLLTAPLSFDGRSVRALDYSLTLLGTEGSVVTSGVSVNGSAFEKLPGKPYYAYRLPAGHAPDFRDITCNGKLVRLAESEKEGTLAFSIPNNKDRRSKENEEPKLYVSEDMVAAMPDGNLSAELWIKVEWQVHAVRITGINRKDTRQDENGNTHVAVFVEPEDWRVFVPSFYATLEGRPYRFKNHISCLETKNSFYYDKACATLYFYPDDDVDMATAVIAYPTLENLLLLTDTRNVTVKNITFTGATSNYVTENGYIAGQGGRIKKNNIGFLTHAAIQSHNGYNLHVDSCIFHDIGGDGINTDGITDTCTVSRCCFNTVGMSPIRIGRFKSQWNYLDNINQNIRILHNYINEPGAVFRSNVGIVIGSVYNLCLCHNTLLNTPYSAISVGWSWNRADYPVGASINILNAEIAYNRVENFMYCMKDGGAIYTLGGNCGIEDHNYYNFIHDNYCVAGPTCGRNSGGYTILYHDGSSSHWKTSRNIIVVNPSAPSRFSYISYQSIPHQQVYNMLACDNYFVNLDDPFYVLGRGAADAKRNQDNFLRQQRNHVGLRMDTLDKKALDIVRAAGAEGYKADI